MHVQLLLVCSIQGLYTAGIVWRHGRPPAGLQRRVTMMPHHAALLNLAEQQAQQPSVVWSASARL